MAELLRELNNDIWHALPRAYGDADAYLALYTPDLIRAGGPTKKVQGFTEFAEITRQWFADLADRGSTVDLEFRFTERIAADDVASERGVFRMTARRASGDQRVFYGQFHTFARRIDGRWRIAVDYDSDENDTVTAESFEAATPVDDIG
jgi:ketosteroid isomerase-like protein